MARFSTRNLVIGAARTLGGFVWYITPLLTKAFIAIVMSIPLKVRIAVLIILAGGAILYGVSAGNGGSSAMQAACKGFRQWQSNHNPATLTRATNNLDHWISAQHYGRGSSDTQWNALSLDTDMGQLDLIVQYGLAGSRSTETRNVVNDCKGT